METIMIKSNEELITIDELCKLLKVKQGHIRSLIFKKELIPLKVGRLIRFKKSDIFEWIKSQGK